MIRLLTLPCLLLLCAPVVAEVSVDVDANTNRTGQHSYDHQSADSQKMEPLRASELMGHSITNGDEETLGSIEDIVLDRKDGSVKYVAVSMGGFLGLGDKLFAVPYNKLDCEKRDGEHVITLDIPKQQLKNAEGFDQDSWPNMADKQWRERNDRAYGSSRRTTTSR